MPTTADDMIAALTAFVPDSNDDANVYALNEITEPFSGGLAEHQRVIPAMFALMERFPEAWLGAPGPLVHCIESVGVEFYEPLLLSSVQRQPVDSNVWMINRILNSELTPEHRRSLLAALHSVTEHPGAPDFVKESAAEFLKFQAEQEAG